MPELLRPLRLQGPERRLRATATAAISDDIALAHTIYVRDVRHELVVRRADSPLVLDGEFLRRVCVEHQSLLYLRYIR